MHQTEPLWTEEDTIAMLFLTVAAVACCVALWVIAEWRDLWKRHRQQRRDNQTLANENRELRKTNRRLVWDLAQANGHVPTAVEHLGLTAVHEDDDPGDPPAWTQPETDPGEPVTWPASLTTAVWALGRDPLAGDDTEPFRLPELAVAAGQ